MLKGSMKVIIKIIFSIRVIVFYLWMLLSYLIWWKENIYIYIYFNWFVNVIIVCLFLFYFKIKYYFFVMFIKWVIV